jgi:hypothetical protein
MAMSSVAAGVRLDSLDHPNDAAPRSPMTTKHLMSLSADAPEWMWDSMTALLDDLVGYELNRTPSAGRPAIMVAPISDRAWITVSFDSQGNSEVLGMTADDAQREPDLPVVLAALDELGVLR